MWSGSHRVAVIGAIAGLAGAAMAALGPYAATITPAPAFGAFGPQGPRMREQLWMVPGGDANLALRATLFRPTHGERAAERRHPLVVINHGSNAATRDAVAMPVFYWLSRWFVDRGYLVLLPQRRGHGATGGDFVEGHDSCANPDHYSSGMAGADDIAAALHYLMAQPFVEPTGAIVVGVSTGGWASLALAARNPPGVSLIVNFAGGRGGHAYGVPHAVCAPERLIAAAGAFGSRARVATLWFYAHNDSYFAPELATGMAQAWVAGGGHADLHLLPDYGQDGHDLVADRAGWQLWGGELEHALASDGAGVARGGGRTVANW
jgi:dienelactone hydrolase